MVSKPTVGQLERKLSQRIQTLYHDRLGKRPLKVDCQFFDEKLSITIEDGVTKAERTLANSGKEHLAEEFRDNIDTILEPQLKALIMEVVGVSALDLLNDTRLETGRSGIVVILEHSPEVRNPSSIPKAK